MSTFGDGGHYSAYNNHINSMGYPSWRWKITGIERSRKWHKWPDVCMRPQERSTEQPSWAQSTESWQINSPLNFEIVYLLFFFFLKTIETSVSGSRLSAYLIPILFCCWSDLSKVRFLLKTLKLFPLTLRIRLVILHDIQGPPQPHPCLYLQPFLSFSVHFVEMCIPASVNS